MVYVFQFQDQYILWLNQNQLYVVHLLYVNLACQVENFPVLHHDKLDVLNEHILSWSAIYVNKNKTTKH